MKLATHNSMSFLKPNDWFKSIFNFFSKCQSLDLVDQWNLGCRLFDLRLQFNFNTNKFEFAHGFQAYNTGILNGIPVAFVRLNSLAELSGDDCWIRLFLEEAIDDNNYYQERKFIEVCSYLEDKFKHLKFFGGTRKFDQALIYRFKYESNKPTIAEKYRSAYNKWPGLFPKFWARINNKKYYKSMENGEYKEDYLMLDFLEIGNKESNKK